MDDREDTGRQNGEGQTDADKPLRSAIVYSN